MISIETIQGELLSVKKQENKFFLRYTQLHIVKKREVEEKAS